MKGEDRLAGQVALVAGGGTGLGRELALALGARGVRVVVAGKGEKALAETVGEIACGGGKARHLVGDMRDRSQLQAAMQQAARIFGRVDVVVAGCVSTFMAAADDMKGPGQLLAVLGTRGEDPEWSAEEGLADLVRTLAPELQAREIRSHGVVPGPGQGVVELVLLLLARPDLPTGRLISAGSELPGEPVEERA
jgi:NAD(P)-dependent dehydrogenase (short-subunit alcohol dehydrogenase family)